MKKIHKVLLIIITLIIISLLTLPHVIKNYINKNGKELVGRKIRIENISINYFTSTIKINDFKLFEPDNKNHFVKFDTLKINTAPYKYINKMIGLDELYLSGLNINVSKKGTVFNFDDIINFLKSEPVNEEKKDNSDNLKYLLENINFKDTSLSYTDIDINDKTSIKDLEFSVPSIAWNQKDKSNIDLKFNLDHSTSVQIETDLQPKNGKFVSTISLNKLQLKSYLNYIKPYLKINKLDGYINSKLVFNGNINDPINTEISGNLDIYDFIVGNDDENEIISTIEVQLNINEININKDNYDIKSLVVKEPYINFKLDSISNNLSRLIIEENLTDSTTVDSTDNKLKYKLDKFKIQNGKLDYTDNLTGKPFIYKLSEIEVDTDSITSESKKINIDSKMILNNRGKLESTTSFNPFNPLDSKIIIDIEDFALSDLNIYSGYYTGHSTLKGDMFYHSNTKIKNGILNSENHLFIKDVDVKNIKGGLFTLPLKMALWLLKDKRGNIDLNIPVRGDMNDPEINAWKLVGNTLKRKIFDTTENPVIALANYINAEPEDIRSITYKYPDTILNEKQKKQLDLIIKLEKEKKGLKTEMVFQGKDSVSSIILSNIKNVNENNLDIKKRESDSLSVIYLNSLKNNFEKYIKLNSENSQIKTNIEDKKENYTIINLNYSLRGE